MPVDIRNFFTAKKPTANTTATAATAADNKSTSNKQPAKKPSQSQPATATAKSARAKAAAAAAKTAAATKQKTPTAAAPASKTKPAANQSKDRNASAAKIKQPRYDGDDDKSSDATVSSTELETLQQEQQQKQRKQEKNSPNNNSQQTAKKRAAAAAVTSTAKESSTSKPAPAKKQRRILDLEDDTDDDVDNDDNHDDEDDDDFQIHSKPTKRRKASLAAAAAAESEEDVDVDLTNHDSDEDDQDDDEDYTNSKNKKRAAVATRSSPRRKAVSKAPASSPPPKQQSRSAAAAAASSSTKKTKAPAAEKRDAPLKPLQSLESINRDSLVPECLKGYTFVFTGELDETLSRPDAEELIKELGGRVTTGVSGKTDYLVVGSILEDGRAVTESKKYQHYQEKFTASCHLVQGRAALYGLIQQYHEKLGGGSSSSYQGNNGSGLIPDKVVVPVTTSSSGPAETSATKPVAPVKNPYAKTTTAVRNPYAVTKTNNPYAPKKPPPVAPVKSENRPAAAAGMKTTGLYDKNGSADGLAGSDTRLWVDKYKPLHSNEILGNGDAVRKLKAWLHSWEDKFLDPAAIGKSFGNPAGPWKAALLSGPPGIGKTTTATLVALEEGRDLIEFNASDVRSKKALHDDLGDITGSHKISFQPVANQQASGKRKGSSSSKTAPRQKRCIIMDEVDGMGAGDRSGISELIQMIKHSRVPIICICNDRQSQKLKSLVPYCLDLKYRRPVKTQIAKRAMEVAAMEGLQVEQNAAEAIAESCGNDMRQVLNCLQMWANNSNNDDGKDDGALTALTYKSLKERENSINKDAILRVSLFDAARQILEGRRGLGAGTDSKTEVDHFFKRNDAFFVDYGFVGLLVQQNYLKVMGYPYNEAKRSNDPSQLTNFLESMSAAADSLSDFAMAENGLRGAQNWGLLPFCGAMAVKTGYHAGGERGGMLAGFPEFTTWLGRNSTKGKKMRLVNELQHHMNYKISGGQQEMRLSYLPVFRDRLLSLLTDKNDEDGIQKAIELMDEYGLDRDDVFEKLDEFNMDPKSEESSFGKIDSKRKAAFTRLYNQGVHKSQALVAEQGAAGMKKSKRGGGGGGASLETADPDAIDDDGGGGMDLDEDEEGEDEEDELDPEKIKASFSKKKGKASGTASGNKSTSTTAAAAGSKRKTKPAAASKPRARKSK